MRMEWAKYEASLAGCGESNRCTAETRRTPRKSLPQVAPRCTEESAYFLLDLLGVLLASGLFLWRFRCDQVVRLANQGFEFFGRQDIRVGEGHPLVASDVRRGGDAFGFEEGVKCFRRAF